MDIRNELALRWWKDYVSDLGEDAELHKVLTARGNVYVVRLGKDILTAFTDFTAFLQWREDQYDDVINKEWIAEKRWGHLRKAGHLTWDTALPQEWVDQQVDREKVLTYCVWMYDARGTMGHPMHVLDDEEPMPR